MEMAEFRKLVVDHWVQQFELPHWKIVVVLPEELDDTELLIWCNENCAKRYFVYNGAHVIFESLEDATGFKLRWL